MLASRDKISMRQAAILFIIAQSSSVIRIIPKYASETVGRAAWLSPLFSVLPFIGLVYIMQLLFKKQRNASMAELFIKVFGNIMGRMILAFYLIWFIILTGLYVRYSAERLLASILPNTSPSFFHITMLAAGFYAARGGIVNIARTVEFLFYLFIVVYVSLFIFSLPNIQKINLLPVTRFDFIPLTKTIKYLLGIWSSFSLVFFFGDKINDKEHIGRFGIQTCILITITCMILLIQTIGVHGHTVVERMPLPYFVSIKSISLLETIERIESVAIAFWMFIDFTVICYFLYMAVYVIKFLFSFSDVKYFASPVALFALIIAFYLGNNSLELEQFSQYIGASVGMAANLILPFVLFLVGKIRKIV